MGSTTTAVPIATVPPVGVEGEQLEALERLVVAPAVGTFEPATDLRAGNQVSVGQVIGHLTSGLDRTPVVSPFAGETAAPLALAGERVISHQPVMWLRAGAPSR